MQVTPAQSHVPAVVAPHSLGNTRGRANDFHVGQTVGTDLEPAQPGSLRCLALAGGGVDVVINFEKTPGILPIFLAFSRRTPSGTNLRDKSDTLTYLQGIA